MAFTIGTRARGAAEEIPGRRAAEPRICDQSHGACGWKQISIPKGRVPWPLSPHHTRSRSDWKKPRRSAMRDRRGAGLGEKSRGA